VSAPDLVSYKDLCLDAVDVAVAADFWSRALNLSVERRGEVRLLTDGVVEHSVWINPVPEPKTVKHRVHLDVNVVSVADLLALGASVVDDSQPWTVLVDPEGGELCAFVRDPEELAHRLRLYEVVIDSADPDRIGGWWAERFGVEVQHGDEDDFCWIEGGPGMPWGMVFTRVPEPKTAKNRVHWDVWGDAAGLVAAGATLLRAPDDEIDWTVLADPEGNEFCVFEPRPPQAD
jgi:hypothetical protein